MKVMSIIGTRPQVIKYSVLHDEIKKHKGIKEVIVDTGQHYDDNMNGNFYKEFRYKPDYWLGMKGEKDICKIEKVIKKEKPDKIIVIGDTNSTYWGCLASGNVPLYHIEAGYRCFDNSLPEERIRIAVDELADFNYTSTHRASYNLVKENIYNYKYAGDLMYDLYLQNKRYIPYSREWNGRYILLTVHRKENKNRINDILRYVVNKHKGHSIIFPVHPSVKDIITYEHDYLIMIDPVGYTKTLSLIHYAYKIITDSGGIIRECYFMKKPVEILRKSWEFQPADNFGDGCASEKIVAHLLTHIP